MNCKTIACMTLFLSLAVPAARGALVLYEGFDYSGTGALTGEAGGMGMWTGAWVPHGTSMTLTDGLTYAGMPVTGGAVEKTGTGHYEANYRSWDTTGYTDPGGGLWFSLLFNTSTDSTGSELRVYPLGGTNFSVGSGVYMFRGENIRVRIEGGSWSNDLYYTRGETALILGRIDFSDTPGQDSLRVWVDPDLDAPPDDADSISRTGTFRYLSRVYMRGGTNWVGEFDEFRMATTFSDVVEDPLYWAPTAGAGGDGPWDATGQFWAPKADGSGTKQAWPTTGTNNDAAFGGAGGEVTIATGGVTANDLLFIAGDYTLSGGKLTLAGEGPAIFVAPSVEATIDSVISGSQGLTKSGAGTLVLSAANEHSGGTTVLGGTLTLTGSNAYTGGTTVRGGTLQLDGGDDRLPTDGAMTVRGGTLDLGGYVQNTGGTVTFAGGAVVNGTLVKSGADYDGQSGMVAANLQGAAGLTKTTGGTLVLSGTNTYAGNTAVDEGILTIESADALPGFNQNNRYTVAPGAILAVGANVTPAEVTAMLGTNGFEAGSYLGFDTGAGNREHADAVTGQMGLAKLGSNTLTLLSGDNEYTGGTVVSRGVLTIGAPGALPGSYSVADGATVALGNNMPDAQFTTILAAGTFAADGHIGFDTSAGDRTYAGALTGDLNLAKVGPNTLTLTASPEHTGTTTIGGGTLRLDARTDTELTGGLRGSGTLRKTNMGVLTLSGANSHTGGVIVDNGEIIADYAAANAFGSGTVTMRGGTLTFRGATDVAVGNIDNVNQTRNEIRVEDGATVTTSRLQGQGIAPWLIDLTGGGTFVATTTTGMQMRDDGVLVGEDRANVYVKDDDRVGFATLDSSTREIIRYTGASELDETNSGNTSNFFTDSSITRTADLYFQTLAIDSTAGPVTLAMGDNTIGSTSRGLGILFTGDHDATISSTRNFDGWAFFSANFGSGTATIDMGLNNIAIVNTAPGLVVATTDTGLRQLLLADGVVRLTGEWDLAMTSGSRLWGGSIVEVGANMFTADEGIDFGLDLGGGNGQIALRGSAGFSAHGQTRTVSLGGTTPTPLTWGSGDFMTSMADRGDYSYSLKFGSPWSDATLVFANPINLNGRERVIDVADGVYSDNVDARLTGALSGTGPLSSLVKTGAGTLALEGDNTYEGATTVVDGTLLVNGSLAGTSGVTVHAGATLGGSGTIAGATTILPGGFLAPGESVGTLTFLDDLDLSGVGPGALRFELGGLDHYDQVVVGGTLTIDELSWDHFEFTPVDGLGLGVYTLFDGTVEGSLGSDIYGTIGGYEAFLRPGSLQLVVIPEPGTWLMLAFGGLALLMIRRRREGARR